MQSTPRETLVTGVTQTFVGVAAECSDPPRRPSPRHAHPSPCECEPRSPHVNTADASHPYGRRDDMSAAAVQIRAGAETAKAISGCPQQPSKTLRVGNSLTAWSRNLWLLFAGLMTNVVSAQTPHPIAPRIESLHQAALDADRLTILQDELQAERGRHADAIRSRAERLAAGDAPGAQEAEAMEKRATANLAGLQREIASVRAPTPARAATASQTPAARPASTRSGAHAPQAAWWDVYGRDARRPRPGAVWTGMPAGGQADPIATPVPHQTSSTQPTP